MTVEEIPQELIDILDERAGYKHSRTGSVVKCLAEILTRYEASKINTNAVLTGESQI